MFFAQLGRVFSRSENRSSAPISGQMAKMPLFGSDFYNLRGENRSTIMNWLCVGVFLIDLLVRRTYQNYRSLPGSARIIQQYFFIKRDFFRFKFIVKVGAVRHLFLLPLVLSPSTKEALFLEGFDLPVLSVRIFCSSHFVSQSLFHRQ